MKVDGPPKGGPSMISQNLASGSTAVSYETYSASGVVMM